MSTIAFAASVVVGGTFLVAGASKIAAGREWPVQARGLGAPRWTIPLVPWIELVLGALLVVRLARPWPALAAVALLLAFTVLIVRRLAAGAHPPCACFGTWSAQPLGARHVVRNGVLVVLAALALA